jgi:hypothetical protein
VDVWIEVERQPDLDDDGWLAYHWHDARGEGFFLYDPETHRAERVGHPASLTTDGCITAALAVGRHHRTTGEVPDAVRWEHRDAQPPPIP